MKDTLKVVQAQKDAIVISKKNISIAKEGGTIEVKVNTNVNFEVQIPSEVTWVTQTESRALTEKSIYLKIAKNTAEGGRSANITIMNQDSQLSETVMITQQGNISVVTLKEAGTMKKLLGEDYLNIASLKVVGPINGDDVYYLRKMLGGSNFSQADWGKLETLDLSDAKIVEGGGWYYEYSASTKYYTVNDEIGKFMFYCCANLKEIELPDGVTSIGDYAFYCDALTSIDIPDNVTSIGNDTFSYCDALTTVTIGDGVTSIGSYAFISCDALTTVTIGDGVTSIGSHAFCGCDALTSIDIPDGVTSIGDYAFYDCDVLTTVTIGDGVTSISEKAFKDCNALTTVTIGDGVTSIGYGVFSECSALRDFYCHATTPPSIRSSSFSTYDDQTTLHVPAGCGSTYKSRWGYHFKNIVEMD